MATPFGIAVSLPANAAAARMLWPPPSAFCRSRLSRRDQGARCFSPARARRCPAVAIERPGELRKQLTIPQEKQRNIRRPTAAFGSALQLIGGVFGDEHHSADRGGVFLVALRCIVRPRNMNHILDCQ